MFDKKRKVFFYFQMIFAAIKTHRLDISCCNIYAKNTLSAGDKCFDYCEYSEYIYDNVMYMSLFIIVFE